MCFAVPKCGAITAEQFADAIGSITGDWHVYQPPDPEPDPKAPKPKPGDPPVFIQPKPGEYTREWRMASSSLTRALGRPIRDQVYSVRDTQPTTLQALELVNGEPLTHWLNRGARKMLGVLPPEPAPSMIALSRKKAPPHLKSIFRRPKNSGCWSRMKVLIRLKKSKRFGLRRN